MTLLALVAFTVSGMLIFLTHEMRLNTDQLAAVLRDAQQVESLRLGLVWYERGRNLGMLTGSAARLEEAEVALTRQAERLKGLSDSSDQALAVGAQQAVERYLDVRQSAERDVESVVDVEARVGPAFRQALGACEALLEQQQVRANDIRERVLRWDVFTDVAGGVTAAVFLIAVGAIVLSTQRRVFLPLFDLRDAIVRFGRGELEARLDLDAPRELTEVAQTFNSMAEKLEHERERRLTFLAAVAHDMASPLMAMKMSAGLARQNHRPMTPEHWRELFDRVDRQVTRLQRMVGDLLDASRIEAGQLELRPERLDLRGLLKDVIDLHHPLPPAHRLSLGLPDEPVWVSVDETRIVQVLNNLISNAIKYSPEGGTVRVRLESDGEAARIAVSDEGIGIPTEDLERVFEPFQRSGKGREEIPGVGLGLSVVRRIVLAHRGSIRVWSTPGVGSTFVVALPLTERAAERFPPAAPPPASPA
jgi:signal transduction histidine kinase